MSALCQKRTHAVQENTGRLGQKCADEIGLTLVFDEGVRAIATAGSFCVPLALVILVLNGFRIAGDFLLGGGRLGRGERVGVGWKALRKHAVDLIGPATVVLDDLVGHISHGTPFRQRDLITPNNLR